MHPNFCGECGTRLVRKGWRPWFRRQLCDDCAHRFGSPWRKLLLLIALIGGAFALGRYLRPSPPPLIIQRMANSPLSDSPVVMTDADNSANKKQNSNASAAAVASDSTDDAVYICGARTKKGTPCHRRVHFAGERCFQHKGMPAILPLDKLRISPTSSTK